MPNYVEIAHDTSDLGIRYIDAHKNEWVAEHGLLVRKMVLVVIDRVEEHIPVMAERALGYVGHTLGIMSMNEVIDALAQMRFQSSWKPLEGVAYRYTLPNRDSDAS